MARKAKLLSVFFKKSLNDKATLDNGRTTYEFSSLRCLYLDAHSSPQKLIASPHKSCSISQGLRAREQSVWAQEQSLLLQSRVRGTSHFCSVWALTVFNLQLLLICIFVKISHWCSTSPQEKSFLFACGQEDSVSAAAAPWGHSKCTVNI